MGFLDLMNGLANLIIEDRGSEFPNEYCSEVFKCKDCGLIWYLPKSIKTNAKMITAHPDYECIKGDGKKHMMVRVR